MKKGGSCLPPLIFAKPVRLERELLRQDDHLAFVVERRAGLVFLVVEDRIDLRLHAREPSVARAEAVCRVVLDVGGIVGADARRRVREERRSAVAFTTEVAEASFDVVDFIGHANGVADLVLVLTGDRVVAARVIVATANREASVTHLTTDAPSREITEGVGVVRVAIGRRQSAREADIDAVVSTRVSTRHFNEVLVGGKRAIVRNHRGQVQRRDRSRAGLVKFHNVLTRIIEVRSIGSAHLEAVEGRRLVVDLRAGFIIIVNILSEEALRRERAQEVRVGAIDLASTDDGSEDEHVARAISVAETNVTPGTLQVDIGFVRADAVGAARVTIAVVGPVPQLDAAAIFDAAERIGLARRIHVHRDFRLEVAVTFLSRHAVGIKNLLVVAVRETGLEFDFAAQRNVQLVLIVRGGAAGDERHACEGGGG